MSDNKVTSQVAGGVTPRQVNQSATITIADARRKALEASDKAQHAQIAYAEEEAKRSYDYRAEE
jgi:hypothetical protein